MRINLRAIGKAIVDHSGTVCAGVAVVGVGTTAYLSGKAAVEVHETVKPEMTKKEKVKAYAKAYWKTAISFVATSGFIFGSDRLHVRKEIGLAGLAYAYKDKFFNLEDKMREKYGNEAVDEIKKEITEEVAAKKADFDEDGLDLGTEEFVVYVPSAEQFFITTEKKLFYALYKTNEEFHKLHDVSLAYYCKKLGRPVNGYRDPMLNDIRWNMHNGEQAYEFEMYGGHWIDYVRDVYIENIKLPDGKVTLANYLKKGDEIKEGSIRAIFFTVDPIVQRFEDLI